MAMLRRELLKMSAAFALAGFQGSGAAEATEGGLCRPTDPLQTLMDGNKRFSSSWREAMRNPDATLSQQLHGNRCFNAPAALIESQQPWATVLTCADSRVSPSWIFDTTPGELFVIRSAGNTAFDEGIASIEYSISVLRSPLLMVMGHSGCGAVAAALSETSLTPSLERLITPIRDQIDGSSRLDDAVRRNARGAAVNLRESSDLLRQSETDGTLKLVVSYFDLSSGLVSLI